MHKSQEISNTHLSKFNDNIELNGDEILLLLMWSILLAVLILNGSCYIDEVLEWNMLASYENFLDKSHIEFLYFLCALKELRRARLLCIFIVTILIFSKLFYGALDEDLRVKLKIRVIVKEPDEDE
jgi:hypothetical protein